MHCCTGNAARTIYYIWDDIVQFEDGRLKVNMLLNRASPWIDIYSHIPYAGRVDFKLKTNCQNVLIHAPEWIGTGSDEIKVTVNDQPAAFTWEERYLKLGKIKAGSAMTINFPITSRLVKQTMSEVEYTMTIKGNEVVAIHPPGRNGPLYQRSHYQQDQTLWRNVNRFVSSEKID